MTPTVAEALAEARTAGVDRLDAHLLLGHVLGRDRTWLVAHGEASMSAAETSRFRGALHRRAAGEPIAYLVGEKEFYGLRLAVNADVLVPRPDTEALVDWATRLLNSTRIAHDAAVVDLGTGSGAIALAVKHACPAVRMVATDSSPAALEVARGNARALALEVEFVAGDWWDAVGDRRFELIVSNPPYIAADDPHLAALGHEPRQALTPGGDGLDAFRRIVAGAVRHAADGAWLLFEHGHDQASAVGAMLREAGWRDVRTQADIAGRPRCTGGRR